MTSPGGIPMRVRVLMLLDPRISQSLDTQQPTKAACIGELGADYILI